MTNVQAGKIGELKAGIKGEILLPSDGAYEDARKIWNAMIDKRPAVIARCATTSDVVRGVNFARDNGLLLAVRGAELRKRSHVGLLSDASPRGSTSQNASKRFHAGTGGVWPSRGTYGEGSVMLMRWM